MALPAILASLSGILGRLGLSAAVRVGANVFRNNAAVGRVAKSAFEAARAQVGGKHGSKAGQEILSAVFGGTKRSGESGLAAGGAAAPAPGAPGGTGSVAGGMGQPAPQVSAGSGSAAGGGLLGNILRGALGGNQGTTGTQAPPPPAPQVSYSQFLSNNLGAMMSGSTAFMGQQSYRQARAQQEGEQELEKRGEKLGKVMSTLTLGMSDLIKANVEYIRQTEAAGSAMLERRFQLAPFSAGIAQTQAELERDRIMRNIRHGRAITRSTQNLAQQQTRLEDATAPWKMASDNISNTFQAFQTNILATLLEGFNNLPVVSQALEYFSGENRREPAGEQMLPEWQHFLSRLDKLDKPERKRRVL